MRKLIALVILVCLSQPGFAIETAYPLEHARIDLSDTASLQRGAKYFVNYCMGCHSLSYLRYNRLGRDLGLTDREVEENLIFTYDEEGAPSKVGSLMTIAMDETYGERSFGVMPPDLTLAARARPHGPDWIYTYLKAFYLDENALWGVNNAVFPNVGMPHVLWELQGWQKPVYGETEAEADEVVAVRLVSEGALSPEEYDQVVLDITNFLTYAAEPVKAKRYTIGAWVIFFLIIFTFVAYLLKKEYWRDIK